MVVARVWLDQVYDVEFVFQVLSDIADLEVKPLGVSGCLMVVFEDQIIDLRLGLHCARVGVRVVELDDAAQVA